MGGSILSSLREFVRIIHVGPVHGGHWRRWMQRVIRFVVALVHVHEGRVGREELKQHSFVPYDDDRGQSGNNHLECVHQPIAFLLARCLKNKVGVVLRVCRDAQGPIQPGKGIESTVETSRSHHPDDAQEFE